MWIKEYSILQISGLRDTGIDVKQVIYSHMPANKIKTDNAEISYVLSDSEEIIDISDGKETFRCAISPGSFIAFKEPFSVVGSDIKVYTIPDLKSRGFGAGDKTFLVTATINDQYTIPIVADNEEDAIRLGNDIPIYLWDHPDIEPHLTERVLVRMARWGNLDAKELA